MKKQGLLILLIEIIIMTLLIFIFIFKIFPSYEQVYSAALIDKVERLTSINEPKIVLIGDSNLAFGIDSAKIEHELKMPVVNMGLHGGLGNAFHEEIAKINITAGDIYVICHTNYSDDDTLGDGVLAWTTVGNRYNLWSLLRKKDIPIMINSFPVYLKKCIRRWQSGTDYETSGDGYYRRSSFNSYGDIKIKRTSRLSTLDIDTNEYCPQINDTCIKRLNELNNYINANGAYMVVAGYPILVKGYPSDTFLEELTTFQSQLEELLKCPVISDFSDYCYDESYFFDTIYHLTDAGADLRTEQLIKDIRSI